MAQNTAASAPQRYMQGIAVAASSVNPEEFFSRTRRQIQTEDTRPFPGTGQSSVFTIKKTGIIAGFYLRFVGKVTSAPGAGQVATTARWPLDLIRQLRFTANGQANLINVSGSKLKVRDYMAKGDLSDRGVRQMIGGQAVTDGTLTQACESWGVGSRATGIAAGNYDVDLEWFVPVAEDQVDLMGAIFAQTSSTDLSLHVDWASAAELFKLTGDAAASLTGDLQLVCVRYTVPLGADGNIVVPDLSTFHGMIQTGHTDWALGENEPPLIGIGQGKTILRIYSQLWNGAGADAAPVPVNAKNFGRMGWLFGANDGPDVFTDGGIMRLINERYYNCDIGRVHGYFCHEFSVENAFRDALESGTASELRQLITLQQGVGALVAPRLEVVVESMFAAGAGS